MINSTNRAYGAGGADVAGAAFRARATLGQRLSIIDLEQRERGMGVAPSE
jgi:hypothetical protein